MTDEYYNIEKIIDRKRVNGKFLYKIKWEGYPMSQCTWEPLKNLENAKSLIEEYDKAHPINIDEEEPTKRKEVINNNKKKKISEEICKENKDNDNIDISKNKNEPEIISENNDDNSKILIYENENSYKVDNSLKEVSTVKRQNGKLVAIVDKIAENGQIYKEYIPTDELRKINPWILLKFYESKIKFT